MEVKILDSIIHGLLKPWKLDTANTRRFTELVKAAKSASPNTNTELHSQLLGLLTDFPDLQKVLSAEVPSARPIQPLIYKSDLPKYKDSVTHFYHLIITGETLRVFNAVLEQSASWSALVDIRYQVGKTLTNIRVLAKQTTEELNEQGFTNTPDAQSSFIHFALYYLKHNLIELYFSIQENFKASLKQVTTIEDFYLLDLEEPLSNLIQLYLANPPVEDTNATADNNAGTDKLSFGFTGDKDRLKAAIVQLCQKIDLVNDEKASADDLFALLTSRDLEANTKQIYLGCETTQFRYIVDKLALHFTNLKLKTIEKTGAFFSKNGTKITAQNLSAGKVDNPKEKGTIDNILKQVQ